MSFSCTEMLGSCIGIAILAMLYEGLKVLREYIDAKFRREVYFVSDPKKVGTDRSSRSVSINDSITASSFSGAAHQTALQAVKINAFLAIPTDVCVVQ